MKYCRVVSAFTLLAWIILTSSVKSSKRCCDDHVLLSTNRQCENNKTVPITCDTSIMQSLSNDRPSPYNHYIILNDTEGEYLEAMSGYTVRAPNFCEGIKRWYGSNVTESVVVFCLTSVYEESKNTEGALLDYYELALTIVNLVSFILLVATALLYFLLPEVQDVDGICTFHFTLNAGLAHGSFFYLLVFRDKFLPNLCITRAYVIAFFVLSAFAWSAVVSFNLWYRLRKNQRVDESKLLRHYRYFAYCVPACLIALANMLAHAFSLYTKYSFEIECYKHEFWVILSIVLPIFVVIIANAFFFICLQINLLNHQPVELNGKRSRLRRITYRLSLFGKLFFIMGLPWSLFIVCVLLCWFLSEFFFMALAAVYYIVYALSMVISAEGVYVFCILIVCRRRMRKTILKRCMPNCLYAPARWRTEKDLETSQESCCSNETYQQENHIEM